MSLTASISHERLKAIRLVMACAQKYVNITEQHSDYNMWEDALKKAGSVVENLTELHILDAKQNGNCETCAPDAFALAEHAKAHALELAEFDTRLKTAEQS